MRKSSVLLIYSACFVVLVSCLACTTNAICTIVLWNSAVAPNVNGDCPVIGSLPTTWVPLPSTYRNIDTTSADAVCGAVSSATAAVPACFPFGASYTFELLGGGVAIASGASLLQAFTCGPISAPAVDQPVPLDDVIALNADEELCFRLSESQTATIAQPPSGWSYFLYFSSPPNSYTSNVVSDYRLGGVCGLFASNLTNGYYSLDIDRFSYYGSNTYNFMLTTSYQPLLVSGANQRMGLLDSTASEPRDYYYIEPAAGASGIRFTASLSDPDAAYWVSYGFDCDSLLTNPFTPMPLNQAISVPAKRVYFAVVCRDSFCGATTAAYSLVVNVEQLRPSQAGGRDSSSGSGIKDGDSAGTGALALGIALAGVIGIAVLLVTVLVARKRFAEK